jgi:hypothetical protein
MNEDFPSSSSVRIRVIKHQKLHAVITLQRYGRGYITRKRLWSYGERFYSYQVLKVQCAWRQHSALKRVKALWFKKVERSVHIIHSLFYFWKSRRIRKIIKLTYLKNVMTTFQANVRRKLTRKKYLVLLFEHKTRNAIRIQSVVREFIFSRRSLKKREFLSLLIKRFSAYSDINSYIHLIKDDISFIIQQKIMEISLYNIPKLKENFLTFSLSIFYDMAINNNFMTALHKLQYLNIYFNKLQYNLMNYVRSQKNNFNKLIYQSFSQSTATTTTLSSFQSGSITSSSLLSYIQNYHQVQFLLQFLNYLSRMMLWTKYNKTRQIHFLFLEQSIGLLSCQLTTMNYNYWNNFLFPVSANPLSLSSLLLFPKQLMNTSRKSFSNPLTSPFPLQDTANTPSDSFSSPSAPLRQNPQQAMNISVLLSLIQMVVSYSDDQKDSNNLSQSMYFIWNQKSFNEICDMFYQITSWNSLSFVKLFDALMLKIDLLFYQITFQDTFEIIQNQTKKLVDSLLFPGDGQNPNENILADSITNRHVYNSPTPNHSDSVLTIHHGFPFFKMYADFRRPDDSNDSNGKIASNTLEESSQEKELITDIHEFRKLQRLRKENAKKKFVKVRKPKKSNRCCLLYRIWKLVDKAREIVIPGSLESYELSYRIDVINSFMQTTHDLYVLRDFIKEFVILFDSQGNTILPSDIDKINSHSKIKSKTQHQNKGNTSLHLQVHIKIIISGPLILVLGAIPPPVSSNTSCSEESKSDEVINVNEKNKRAQEQTNKKHLQTHIYDKIPMFPWPLHPLILFSHEINNIANAQHHFSVNQYPITDEKLRKPVKISRRLSSNQWLDYEKFADYLCNQIAVIFTTPSINQMNLTNSLNIPPNLQQQSPFLSTDSEPLLSFYLSEISMKRKFLLENNIMKYSVIVIQRVFRGFLGRQKFAIIRKQYLVMKRKRYLSYKVFYRLKVMYANHQRAAIQIQRIGKGYILRKAIKRWNKHALVVQCAIRIFFARKRIREERKRLFDGPQVVLMNRGGKIIEIQSQMIQLLIYRCNIHYKFRGINIISNKIYVGYCYAKELKSILGDYNADVIESLNGDSQSLFSKQLQIQIWQYEKLISFFYKFINLLPKIYNVTNAFNNSKIDESEWYLAVCYKSWGMNEFIQQSRSQQPQQNNNINHSHSKPLQPLKTSSSSSSLWAADKEEEFEWKKNYDNMYRSSGTAKSKESATKTIALPATNSTLSLQEPSTRENKLQKSLPIELTNYPIIESVKKFNIFKEYNAQIQKDRKRRGAMIESSTSSKPKSPKVKIQSNNK